MIDVAALQQAMSQISQMGAGATIEVGTPGATTPIALPGGFSIVLTPGADPVQLMVPTPGPAGTATPTR
jgi:hypothetical protein